MNTLVLAWVAPRAIPHALPRASVRRLCTILRRAHRCMVSGSVTIVTSDDRTMRALNRRYRGKHHTTDVLSFLYHERKTRAQHTIVGDILLSRAEIRRQARERKLRERDVMRELIIHGILHLFGYDHERSEHDATIMFGLQKKILEHIF